MELDLIFANALFETYKPWWSLGWCLLVFLIGFFIGWLIWRRGSYEAVWLETENRKMHTAYKKRERTFIENREQVSSLTGRDNNQRR